MPRVDGGDHGGVGQGLSLEELLLHPLVGIPEIGLMERGEDEHLEEGTRAASPGLGKGPLCWAPSQGPDPTASSVLGGWEGVCRSCDASWSICCSLLVWSRSVVQPHCRPSNVGTVSSNLGTVSSNCGVISSNLGMVPSNLEMISSN